MMKKGVIAILLFIFVFSFVIADNSTNVTNITANVSPSMNISAVTFSANASKIDKGFICLKDKVKTDCSGTNNIQEIALTILASPDTVTTSCVTKLKGMKNANGCFGTSCNVRDTALAILALDHVGENSQQSQSWLMNQTKTATDLTWFLEQDSNSATQCKFSYDAHDYISSINENKKIEQSAGPCLSLAQSSFWLQVSPTCYDREFSVTCDKDFIATFLYKQLNGQTIYVLSDTKSAAANNEIKLKIKSKCFGTTTCDYEGSAWATLALQKTGHDIAEYVPYLVASEDSNIRFLPDAFLNMLVDYSEYGNKLIQLQKLNMWEAEGSAYGKYYDSALALISLSNSNSPQIDKTKEWLINFAQEANGCWNSGSIRDTAIILWALEHRSSPVVAPGITTCAEAGHFCVQTASCSLDQQLGSNFYCPSLSQTCCKSQNLQTCSEKLGVQCTGDKVCSGSVERTSDVQSCCLAECVTETPQPSQCESLDYRCKSSCSSGETEESYSCDSASLVCCNPTQQKSGSLLWLWILLIILIILVILAIIYKEKVRIWWFQIKSKFKKEKEEEKQTQPGQFPPRPGFPPIRPQGMPLQPRPMQGQPLRRPMGMAPQRPPMKKDNMDDVLKKLKDITEK